MRGKNKRRKGKVGRYVELGGMEAEIKERQKRRNKEEVRDRKGVICREREAWEK